MHEGEMEAALASTGSIDVLVVDDDEAGRNELVSSLDRARISCLPAADGWSALRLLLEGCRPNLIVADIRMPELSGLEFAEQVCRLRNVGAPKLVLISGHAGFDDVLAGLRLGVLDFLPKPIDLRRLVQVVRTVQLDVRTAHPPDEAEMAPPACPPSDSPSGRVRQILAEARHLRMLRGRYLSDGLFSEPSWEMLLELYAAYLNDTKLSVTSLGGAVEIPMTTALRRINDLERSGMIVRTPDGKDRRRATIELSRQGHLSVEGFLKAYSGNRTAGSGLGK